MTAKAPCLLALALALLPMGCGTLTKEPPAPPAPAATTAPEKPTATTAAAKPAGTPPPVARAPATPKPATPAPVAAKPKAPTLDLASLERRLKDSPAIGLMTKITLKNQVDDLLDKFRAYYQGKLKASLAELRQPYETLLMKVLSLLQDSDPALASDIIASREAIWGILSDPKKFSSI